MEYMVCDSNDDLNKLASNFCIDFKKDASRQNQEVLNNTVEDMEWGKDNDLNNPICNVGSSMKDAASIANQELLNITDECGLCVADLKGISQRISNMDQTEKEYVEKISPLFLKNLIISVHGKTTNAVKNSMAKLGKIIIDDIHSNEAKVIVKSFKRDVEFRNSHQDSQKQTQEKASLGSVFSKGILGALNPTTLLSTLSCADKDTGGEGIMSSVTNTLFNNNKSHIPKTQETIKKLLNVTNGFNPIGIKDTIYIEKCSDSDRFPSSSQCSGQYCQSLSQMLNGEIKVDSPIIVLMTFLKCLNHRRLYFGNEKVSAEMSPLVLENMENRVFHDSVIVVPLRKLLLSCIGDSEKFSDGAEFVDNDILMNRELDRCIGLKQVHEQGLIAMIYSYLLFSKYICESADIINRLFYISAARFIYSAAEKLYCERENSSRWVDNGLFLKYVSSFIPCVIMSSPFIVEKAHNAWRTGSVSSGVLLDLISSNWNENYNSREKKLVKLSSIKSNYDTCINKLSSRSLYSNSGSNNVNRTFINTNNNDNIPMKLTDIKSFRSMQCYNAYGVVKQNHNRGGRGPIIEIDTSYLSIACKKPYRCFDNRRNNDNDIFCNIFSVLPTIIEEECLELGPNGLNDQAQFDSTFIPGEFRRGMGKFLGLFTAVVDRAVIGKFFNGIGQRCEDESLLFKDDEKIFNLCNSMLENVVFNYTALCERTFSNFSKLPERSELVNPNTLFSSNRSGGRARSLSVFSGVDIRPATIFLPWQRPNIPNANISALSVSQLELSLSREPSWSPVLSLMYFNLERVCFQVISSLFKVISSEEEEDGSDVLGERTSGGRGVLFSLFDVNNHQKIQLMINKSISDVKSKWTNMIKKQSDIETKFTMGGVNTLLSYKLYKEMRTIIIDDDWSPVTLITRDLSSLIGVMDDILISALGCDVNKDLVFSDL